MAERDTDHMTEPEAGDEYQIVWTPDETYRERSRLRRFMENHRIANYDDLLARAAADPAWYWDAVVKELDLVWHRPYEQVLDLSRGKPWAEWFTGGGFNYVTSALDRHVEGPVADRIALIWEGDDGAVRRFSRSTRRYVSRHWPTSIGKRPVWHLARTSSVVSAMNVGRISGVRRP